METAGRAVVFSGTTVGDRPAGDDRAAAAVPALDRLRRHADPAGQRRRRHDAAAGRAGRRSARGSTGRTCARRPGQPLLDRVGTLRRPPALAGRGAAPLVVLAALVIAGTSLQPGTRRTPTPSPSTGDARTGLVALERSGIGAGRARADRGARRRRGADRRGALACATVARRPRRVRRDRRRRGSAAAPRSSTCSRPPTARPGRTRHDHAASGPPRTRSRPAVRVGGVGAAERRLRLDAIYGSFPLMIALIARTHVPAAGARVPLAAAAAQGGGPERASASPRPGA